MHEIQTINPATEDLIGSYQYFSSDRVKHALGQAESAFAEWKRTTFTDRANILRKAGDILRERSEEFAQLMTGEMGKPIVQARAEVAKSADGCDFYAEHAEEFLAPESIETSAQKSVIRHDPIGAVFAVMPWNFPFWQVFRFAAPTLMAGNVCLLKHASNVTGCSLTIERIFREAGLPEGCFQSLVIPSSQAESVVAASIVRAVTLTGSDAAGRAVAKLAAQHLKKCVLELGGSDPFVVLADAPIADVAAAAVRARTLNSGQSCIAAKRFIVEGAVHDEFVSHFVSGMQALRVGDPLDESTDVGPLAREEFLIELHDQAVGSTRMGAKLRCGGERIDRPGYFYKPTIMTHVEPEMPAFKEETFGPLAAVTIAKNEADAIRLANETAYGLGASIWTGDDDRGWSLAERIDAGNVFVNEVTKSDPHVPFGGVKQSGYGRELSRHGILEFVNVKTVWLGDLN